MILLVIVSLCVPFHFRQNYTYDLFLFTVCHTNPPHMNNSSLFGGSSHSHGEEFDKVWNVHYTVPFFLILVLGPLVNFKSPTFFTKFNALGKIYLHMKTTSNMLCITTMMVDDDKSF